MEKTDEDAARAGISTKASVREGLIAWREEAMKLKPPHWEGVVLLSHAIWWLADDE